MRRRNVNIPRVRGPGSSGTVGDGNPGNGICDGDDILITSTGGTPIIDDINSNEILTVRCRTDGTMDVFYYDRNDISAARLGVTDVLITCY